MTVETLEARAVEMMRERRGVQSRIINLVIDVVLDVDGVATAGTVLAAWRRHGWMWPGYTGPRHGVALRVKRALWARQHHGGCTSVWGQVFDIDGYSPRGGLLGRVYRRAT